MTQDMYRGVKRAAIIADRDPDIDVLVLTGTDDVFCVGGDMARQRDRRPHRSPPSWIRPTTSPSATSSGVPRRLSPPSTASATPVVSTSMLHCDFVDRNRAARFRAPELLRGAPDVFMATRLADWVGLGNAKWIMFAMEAFDAERAMQMGLVQQVVPDDEFDDAVDRLVDAVTKGAPKSRAVIKDDINRQLRPHDARVFQRSIMNPEMREGMGAFVEKRDPVWPRD